MRPRRALLSVSDKSGLVELGRALHAHGVELVATGKTADVLRKATLPVADVQTYSGTPEAFGGRMKTLSFQILSGILFRRGHPEDVRDVQALNVPAIDVVVVNFYPFESDPTIEQVDIGGPTLVRAAAKNAPDVLVLVDPSQYGDVIQSMNAQGGSIDDAQVRACAARAWERVLDYDRAIADRLGEAQPLRYGENPHQQAWFKIKTAHAGGMAWETLTDQALSYNNILDLSAAYTLLAELMRWKPEARAAVIVKHGNPCGVALSTEATLLQTLEAAWQGDPVSAFGGIVALSHPFDDACAEFLSQRFVEALAVPKAARSDASADALARLAQKRKKLKAVAFTDFNPQDLLERVSVAGGELWQTRDVGLADVATNVTQRKLAPAIERLVPFGIAVARALKSNAVAAVGPTRVFGGGEIWVLAGTGQGQPNRVEAIRDLMIPRARAACERFAMAMDRDLLVVSDAFFPFPDSIEILAQAGLTQVVQPGGSIKDAEVVAAANRCGVAMATTSVRHFKHV